jgi:type II secretory pathway component GspD/PulD (secretin)
LQDVHKGWLQKYREHLRRLLPQIDVCHGEIMNTLIDAIALMLSSDYRFKVVSSPSMRVRSGRQETFSVGQEVPVLGAIQRSTDKPPLQSIEYRSSGVIFEVLPTVHEGAIELDIRQELSHFVQTRTGVSNSPTLTKQSLTTSVNLGDGDLIILGGLAD